MEKLLALSKTARMGDPMAGDTQVGPITTRPQYDKVLSYIDIAKQDGAQLALGGKPRCQPQFGKGWLVEPNIFTAVTKDMILAHDTQLRPCTDRTTLREMVC